LVRRGDRYNDRRNLYRYVRLALRPLEETVLPSDLPDKAFLEYYADHFGTAEITNSFYRLPKKETLVRWRDAVPEGFVFSVKASRTSPT
jgi:uncharacterized protein YecE (DUF72 family)